MFSMNAMATLCLGICVSTTVSAVGAAVQGNDRALVDDAEEYAVYNAVLDSIYASSEPKPQQFVINVEPITETQHPSTGTIGGLTGTGAARPETAPDTKSDFDEKGKKSCRLDRRFDLKVPYTLVVNDDLNKIFALDPSGHIDPKVWDHFYQRYPGAAGIVAFSRVGFDSKKNQALVYLVIQYGLVGGSGEFCVLVRNDGKWTIEKQVLIWLS
jgi:hypothetical protein